SDYPDSDSLGRRLPLLRLRAAAAVTTAPRGPPAPCRRPRRRECAETAPRADESRRSRFSGLMVTIQPIEHNGRVVAVVAGGRALIGDELARGTLALLRAKCLFALEVQSGDRPGPYSDQTATRFAQRARARP